MLSTGTERYDFRLNYFQGLQFFIYCALQNPHETFINGRWKYSSKCNVVVLQINKFSIRNFSGFSAHAIFHYVLFDIALH